MSMKNSMLFSPLNDKGWTLHVKDWCGVQLPLHESPTLIKCSKIFFFFTIPIIKSNSKVLASAQPVPAVPIDTIPPRLDKNTRPCLLHNLIYARAWPYGKFKMTRLFKGNLIPSTRKDYKGWTLMGVLSVIQEGRAGFGVLIHNNMGAWLGISLVMLGLLRVFIVNINRFEFGVGTLVIKILVLIWLKSQR